MGEQINSFESVIPFGKHKGKKLCQIIQFNPGYIIWLRKNTSYVISDDVFNLAYQCKLWKDYYDESEDDLMATEFDIY